MNIRIIKNVTEYTDCFIKNGYMVQVRDEESDYGDIKAKKYFLYDLSRNESIEIEPSIPKYNLINVKDIKSDSDYVYFTSIKKGNEDEKHLITVYRYSISTKECSIAYSFEEKLEKYQDYMRTTIFAINEYYLIVQNEFLRANLTEEYVDYFDFELYLYSISEDKKYKITDERFIRYGISYFESISSNMCVIKLGYDLLKDNRYNILKKNEAAKESISFVNIGQMVSDILIGQQEVVINTIENVYYTATIPYIKLIGEYIIYSKVKLEENFDEEIIFYNYATKETIMCINSSSGEDKEPILTCVIDNEPYVIRTGVKGYEFINVKQKETVLYINHTDKIENIMNNIIVVSGQDKGFFGKIKPYVMVYKAPTAKVLHKEKGSYVASFFSKDEQLYIVTNS